MIKQIIQSGRLSFRRRRNLFDYNIKRFLLRRNDKTPTIVKYLFLLLISSPIILNAQTSTKALDNGFGVLKKNIKLDDVKKFLVKIDENDLKDTHNKNYVGQVYSSAWTVDLKKAKMETYFGLKVQRIEVNFIKEKNAHVGPMAERVKAFIIFTDKPSSDKEGADFRSKLMKEYGDGSLMLSPDAKDVVSATWDSDTTVLTVIYGIDYATGNKQNFYQARYE
jgi:hypothetical protein